MKPGLFVLLCSVLHDGRLLELGNHDALMRQDGRYAHLFRLQARGYLD